MRFSIHYWNQVIQERKGRLINPGNRKYSWKNAKYSHVVKDDEKSLNGPWTREREAEVQLCQSYKRSITKCIVWQYLGLITRNAQQNDPSQAEAWNGPFANLLIKRYSQFEGPQAYDRSRNLNINQLAPILSERRGIRKGVWIVPDSSLTWILVQVDTRVCRWRCSIIGQLSIEIMRSSINHTS